MRSRSPPNELVKSVQDTCYKEFTESRACVNLISTRMVFLACSATAYFDMPAALRYMAQNQAAAASRPPVTVSDLELDPCNMRLVIGTLRATEHFGSQRFS